MSNFDGFSARDSWISFLHHNQFFDVIITFFNYDIKKLIMMQKLEPRNASLKPTKTGNVHKVMVPKALRLSSPIFDVMITCFNYDIKKLIMMQKALEPLQPFKLGIKTGYYCCTVM